MLLRPETLVPWSQDCRVDYYYFADVLCSVVLKLTGRFVLCATLQTANTCWPPVIPRASVSTQLSIRSWARSLTSRATCRLMERWSVPAYRVLNLVVLTVWECSHRYLKSQSSPRKCVSASVLQSTLTDAHFWGDLCFIGCLLFVRGDWCRIFVARLPFLTPFLEQNLWRLVAQGSYGPDVHLSTQLLVSKHWREHKALTPTSGLASSYLHSQPDSWWKGRCCLCASSDASTRTKHVAITVAGVDRLDALPVSSIRALKEHKWLTQPGTVTHNTSSFLDVQTSVGRDIDSSSPAPLPN